MSRSRKKTPITKVTGNGSKALANRKLRKRIKEAVHRGAEVMPLSEELTNPYDLCDWKHIYSREELKQPRVKKHLRK
jgi:hypothetical protein